MKKSIKVTDLFRQIGIKMTLVAYDTIIFLVTVYLLFILYKGGGAMDARSIMFHSLLAFAFIFGVRGLAKIYQQVWRYGGIQSFIRLLLSDIVAGMLFIETERLLPIEHIEFVKMLSFCSLVLLGSLGIRMLYRYAYKCGSQDNRRGQFLRFLLRISSGGRVNTEADSGEKKIQIAIIGAGSVGVSVAEELWADPRSKYNPSCFIDSDASKAGRDIRGVSVLTEDEATMEVLRQHHIQDVVFAVPSMSRARKLELIDRYNKAGFGIKVYDFAVMDMPGRKRQIRDIRVEDLLMREQKKIIDAATQAYYNGKVILITGGGGSIGSELCRQLARMSPRQIIIVDIYENNAYDLQHGLTFAYKGQVDIRVEIVSITNRRGLAKVFEEYHPDICINAAAHKHVPLMEKNCVEAVQNNVFGTLNVIQLCEEYGCVRFMMVSTDKAVNPTNVMGATKRMCEMVMQAYSTRGIVKCSATRFGNVLGSAGSVIPLFKRQIQAGGPVTVTDKRIIRYFMTIPEASQLVLVSGAIARNGDLFVLDMGSPVRIYDLAVNMIQLSGADDIEIIETGLRPGEKLYEELLVNGDNLQKTENDLIFIEHEAPVSMPELDEKLSMLRDACEKGDDDGMRNVLKIAVPTFRSPEEVNGSVN